MIEQLLEQLHTTDASERRNALEILFDFACDDRVLEAAAYLLTDMDRGVRDAASRLLVLCSNDKAASLTAVHILSRNITVRNLAGDALVRMGGAAVNALLPYVDSADKDVRKFAIDILAQLTATPTALKRIAAHLSDSDPNVVCAAIDALGALHAEKYTDHILALYDKVEYAKPNVVNAVAKFPQKVELQFLEKALADDDPVVQLAAAEALASRKDSGLLNIILQKLNSISDLAKPVLLHSVVKLLESTDYPGGLPGDLKIHLLEMLDDTDTSYVRAAVRGLRYFINENVLEALIAHVGKTESVDNAIFSILKDRAEEVLPLILKFDNEKANAAALVKMTLSMIRNCAETSPGFTDSKVMEEAAVFISKNFLQLDVDAKVTALNACNDIGSHCAATLVKAALDDPESPVKIFALDLAARIGPQLFIQQLEKLSEDYDEDVRYTATAILSQLKPGHQNQV